MNLNYTRLKPYEVDSTDTSSWPAMIKDLSDGKLTLIDNGFQKQTADWNIETAQIQLCSTFLDTYALPRKTINDRHTSYSYKHHVEQWTTYALGSTFYISNGAFIAAALREGYACRVINDGPNAEFAFNYDYKKLKGHGLVTGDKFNGYHWGLTAPDPEEHLHLLLTTNERLMIHHIATGKTIGSLRIHEKQIRAFCQRIAPLLEDTHDDEIRTST